MEEDIPETNDGEQTILDDTDAQMGIKERVITGDDGTVTLRRLVPGTYCIREVETLPGYVPDDTVYEFVVDGDGKINGRETDVITIENDATRIVKTSVHNVETNDREAEPGFVEATDRVSMENLQPRVVYRLKGVLVDWKTGKPLRENGKEEGAVLMCEREFTADAEKMDVDMHFTFDAAWLEGRTISVFEYLYQDGVEISSHTDLDDIYQQLHIRNADVPLPEEDEEKAAPRTGDSTEASRTAVLAALAAGSIILTGAALGALFFRRRPGRRYGRRKGRR